MELKSNNIYDHHILSFSLVFKENLFFFKNGHFQKYLTDSLYSFLHIYFQFLMIIACVCLCDCHN